MDSSILVLPLLLAVAAIHDLRSREIPDWIPAFLGVTGLALSGLGLTAVSPLVACVGLICGLAIGLLFFMAAGFGGGDAKLVAALGIWLGPWGLLQGLFWVAMAGMLLAVLAGIRGRKDFAYAPALLVGIVLSLWCPEAFQVLSSGLRSLLAS